MPNVFWENKIVWFEENLFSHIFYENILFDSKKIYCQIYFGKIKLFDLKKKNFPYILRKYTIWFEENLLPNIFLENKIVWFEENLFSHIF